MVGIIEPVKFLALGLVTFKRLDEIIEKRNMIANLYKSLLSNKNIVLPNFTEKNFGEGWHLFQLNNIDFNSLNLEKENFIKYLQGFL